MRESLVSRWNYPPSGAQIASAREATGFGWMSLGALAVGATAVGAVAIGALAVRELFVKRGRIGRLEIDELDVGRLRVRELVIEEERSGAWPFRVLRGYNYVRLTTFRKSGEAVHTPVWFAPVGNSIYVTTSPTSGKMKRIRNNPQVVLTPCDVRGNPCGESIEGVGRIIEGSTPEQARAALREKYRLGLALFHLFGKRKVGEVIPLEISPADMEGAESS